MCMQSYTVKHFIARVLCLIIMPALLYMGIFYIHLEVLNNTGPGDGFYSSAFQISLKGNYLHTSSTPRGNFKPLTLLDCVDRQHCTQLAFLLQ